MTGSGFSGAVQTRNSDLVDLLRSDFQHRNEPNFAWKSAVSAATFLPGLIASWPMSIARLDSQTDRIRDVGGGGYHLTTINDPLFRRDNLVPVVEFDGASEYSMRTAGAASWASILGTEAYIHANQQGLFVGGWFNFDDALGTDETIIAKWGAAAGTRSYRIRRAANGDATFSVSDDGSAVTTATVAGGFDTANVWYFVMGIFDNVGNELRLWVNTSMSTTVYNNTIFDGTADFTIGSRDGPAEYFDGTTSLCVLGAFALLDVLVWNFYQQTRAMFGR